MKYYVVSNLKTEFEAFMRSIPHAGDVSYVWVFRPERIYGLRKNQIILVSWPVSWPSKHQEYLSHVIEWER